MSKTEISPTLIALAVIALVGIVGFIFWRATTPQVKTPPPGLRPTATAPSGLGGAGR